MESQCDKHKEVHIYVQLCIVTSGATKRMDLDGQAGVDTCVDNVLLD